MRRVAEEAEPAVDPRREVGQGAELPEADVAVVVPELEQFAELGVEVGVEVEHLRGRCRHV